MRNGSGTCTTGPLTGKGGHLKGVVALAVLATAVTSAPAQMSGQIPPDTLAQVGSGFITGMDLIERIELMPWPLKDRFPAPDSSKVLALQSMVAERLLAQEAVERGIGQDSMTQLRSRALEAAFVRDELYKKEVAAKVRVGAQEVREGLSRYALQLEVLILHCPGEQSARALSEALGAAKNADSVLSDRGVNLSADTVTVNFGLLTEPWENLVYSLDVEHPVSAATNSPSTGWVVLYLLDGRTNPAYSKQSTGDRQASVKRIIQFRKAQDKGVEYMASLLKNRKAEAEGETLRMLGDAIYSFIAPDSSHHKRGGRFFLAPEEIDLLEDSLQGSLARVLVSMPGTGLTLGTALQALRLEPFSCPSLGHTSFAFALNETVKRIAREEFLSREGYRKNLQNTAQVRHDVSTWADKRLSEMMEDAIPQTPSEGGEDTIQALIEHANLLGQSYQVNVREILTDSLSAALRYQALILGGADMAHLAREVSKRPGWAERDGESRFFSARTFPQLGVRALEADTGALLGPVKVTEGYSLFRVLGKRQLGSDTAMSLGSLRKMIGSTIPQEKRRHEVDVFIAGLASKYGVHMYYDKLKAIQIFPHNMFTRRNIGFGGVIAAAPLLAPHGGWVETYERATNVIP